MNNGWDVKKNGGMWEVTSPLGKRLFVKDSVELVTLTSKMGATVDEANAVIDYIQDELPKPISHSLSDVLTNTPDEPSWVVKGIVAQGAITSLAGFIGVGKTPLALQMIRSILAGDADFLSYPVSRITEDFRIAYLTQENAFTFGDAARRAGLADVNTSDFDVYFWDENALIDWDVMVDYVAGSLEGDGLLVVDVVLDWSDATDENDAADMRDAYQPLVTAAGKGISVLAVVHTVKTFDRSSDEDASTAAVRGSGSVVANSSVVLLYKQARDVKSADKAKTRFLKIGRTRYRPPTKAMMYTKLDDSGRIVEADDWEIILSTMRGMKERVLYAVERLNFEDTKATRKEIQEVVEGDNAQRSDALHELEAEGSITKHGKGVAGNPFYYTVA